MTRWSDVESGDAHRDLRRILHNNIIEKTGKDWEADSGKCVQFYGKFPKYVVVHPTVNVNVDIDNQRFKSDIESICIRYPAPSILPDEIRMPLLEAVCPHSTPSTGWFRVSLI